MSTDAKPTTDATATPPPATNGAALNVNSPTDEKLMRELIELERHFPPPEQSDIFADARWLQEHWGTAVLEPYRGTHVVILNGAVVAHGSNALLLQLETVKRFNVHPQRFILEYIPRPTSEVYVWPSVWFPD